MELDILLLEDNEADVYLLNEYLFEIKGFEFRLHHYKSYLELLAKPVGIKPSVIILDLNLPDMRGEDLFKKIYHSFKGVPIILLTGIFQDKLATTLIQKGAQDYLVKGDISSIILEKSIRYSIERKNFQQRIISSFKALDATRRRLKLHLDKSRLGLILLNEQGLVEEWSETCEQIFGISAQEALHKYVLELPLFTIDALKKVEEALKMQVLLDGKENVLRLRNLQRGRIIYCEWFISSSTQDLLDNLQTTVLVKDISEEVNFKVAYQKMEEEERKRLSREIHDGIGQMMIVIKMRLQQLIETANSNEVDKLRELLDLLQLTQEEAKNISRSLVPRGITEFGLRNPLQFLTQLAAKASNISIQFICEDDLKFLPEDTAFGLYRIIQEAINNMLKHADASEAKLRIDCQKDYIYIEVADNGKGFDTRTGVSYQGLGLQSMRERAFLMGANLEIESLPGAGTSIKLQLPLIQHG